MPELDAETIRMEIEYTDEKIIGITGQKPAFFRPPYIDVNNVMVENIDKPFICGINGLDWENNVSAQRRAEMILGKVADGNIILMHDTEGNDKTVEALDLIIPELLARGYEFLTVSALFESKGITPGVHNGVVYSDVLQTRRFDE